MAQQLRTQGWLLRSTLASREGDHPGVVAEGAYEVVGVREGAGERQDEAVVVIDRERDHRRRAGTGYLNDARPARFDGVSAVSVPVGVNRQHEAGAREREVLRPGTG